MTTLLTGALLGLGTAVGAIGAFVALTRWVPGRFRTADGDLGGAVLASVGLVYAILIAIASIAVWEPHSAAAQSSDREAGDLTEVYWMTRTLPTADRDDIRARLQSYTTTVVDEEWPALRTDGEASPRAAARFDDLRVRIEAVTGRTEHETVLLQQTVARMADAADARRERIAVATAEMPPLLWPALIASSLASVALLFLFGARVTPANLALVAVVGAMTATLLFVLYEIELPYSRAFAVGPDDFRAALARFTEMV